MKTIVERSFPILTGGLFLALAGESLYFYLILNERVPWYFPVTGFLSDLLWPACLLACALFSASAFFYILFACSAGALLFLKTANLCLFRNTFEIFTAANLRLLLDHTDAMSLRLEFGPLYGLKIAAIALAFACGIFLLAWSGIRFARAHAARAPHGARAAVLILILFSLAADLAYREYSEDWGKGFFQREFVARPAEVQISEIVRDFSKTAPAREVPPDRLPEGFFPGSVSSESEAILTDWGLLPRTRESGLPPADPEIRRILVLAVESLDFGYLRANEPSIPEGVTPFLDSLTKNYLSFRNYFTGSQPTSWALDCIFLSRPDFLADLSLKNVSLCDILRERGWTTWYFSPASSFCFGNGRDYRRLFRPDHAVFQEQFFQSFGYRGSHYWGLGDDELLDGVFRMLESAASDRFFCVVSTIDLHDPYTVSGPAASLESTGSRFLDALRSTDRNLQAFLERVMSSSLFDEHTLIVLTADHSATFGENYTRRPDFLPVRIPLIFITKNDRLRPLFDPDRFGSQMDLPPTLLSLLGIPAPETFMGRDLRCTGKSCAFTKTVDLIRLHLPDGRLFACPLQPGRTPATPEGRALLDFYRLFYGPEKP